MITNKILTVLSIAGFLAGTGLALFAADNFQFFAQIILVVTLILTAMLVRKGMIRTLDNETRTFFKTSLLFLLSPLIILGLQSILLTSESLLVSSILSALYLVSLSFVSFMGDP